MMVSGLRLAAAGLLTAVALGTSGVPVARAGTTTCRVRNVTQDTVGRSLSTMVQAAADGDRLQVRGTCRGGVVIDKDLVIRGVGERPRLIGGSRARVVSVGRDAAVTIRDLGFVGGVIAISNRGTLHLRSVTIRHNTGGIRNDGVLIGARVRVVGSSSTGIGNGGSMLLTDSVIRGNTGGAGGGIHNEGYEARLTLARSRVVDNTAVSYGGGIFNMLFGTVMLIETVVTGNVGGDVRGAGIHNYTDDDPGGPVVIDHRSMVVDNVPDDCWNVIGC